MPTTLQACALAVAMFGTCAQAQSNLSIYGLVDDGFLYISDVRGASQTKVFSGAANRLGFRGTEELGGGTTAFFKLESGFSLNTGAFLHGGRAFGRESYVGLGSSTLGSISLGRQYDSVVDFLSPLSAGYRSWAGGYGAHFADLDNMGRSLRLDNVLKYTSPTQRGWTFGGMYKFGEVAQSSANSGWGLGLSKQEGPLTLAAAYFTLDRPPAAAFDGNVNGVFRPDSPYAGLWNADQLETYGVGANYRVGRWLLGALYTHVRLKNSVLAAGDADYRNHEVSATWDISPAWFAGAGYTFTAGEWQSSGAKPRFHQVNLGGGYNLSKRTSLYAYVIHQKASGSARFAQQQLAGGPSSTDRQTLVQVALKHGF
ncbi:MAG TPA: porin [Ramlibacter sp.]|nr:porin [Ramlibacter sp.]